MWLSFFFSFSLCLFLSLKDLSVFDPTYAQSLQWILANDIASAGLDMTFEVEREAFGHIHQDDLIPNGREIFVTEVRKSEVNESKRNSLYAASC